MEKELNNTASVVGTYNNVPTSITSLVSVVTIIDGLSITKTADKVNWADGELTYTIAIINNAEKTYESPTITDKLDGTNVEFVDKSVTIDGTAASESEYEFDSSTNTLTVKLTNIDVSKTKTVTFKVRKKS